jgi:hypothetical protein
VSDIGVLERSEYLPLLAKALVERAGSDAEVATDELDGDLLIEFAGTARKEDSSHPALP